MYHGRIINTDADVAAGLEWLGAADPRLVPAIAQCGSVPLRRRADGFSELLCIIVGQQVSTAAAAAIWERMGAAGLITQEAVLEASDAALQGAGLSRPKMRYARALAAAEIDFAALRDLPDDAVMARLTDVTGIGAWTAEIYAMFCLGRADVFAPGDLALREAARVLLALPGRPTPAEMACLAQAWSPWRAVAARLLFAYYRVAKGREGLA